jgi:hypothetical protein
MKTFRRLPIATLLIIWYSLFDATFAFSPPSKNTITSSRPSYYRDTTTLLHEQNNNNNILERFANPQIDDPWLPLTEAGLAQVVAPTLQLFWLVAAESSAYPSWATPLYDPMFATSGAFLAPTLIHGAGLACCWLLGCLAAKGYERTVYEGSFGQVAISTIQAGAFATGLLLLATQFHLYQEMGSYVQVGDSPETDMRIYQTLVEVTNDIFFEATTLLTWRLYRSTVT